MPAKDFLDIDDSASIIIEWRSGGGPIINSLDQPLSKSNLSAETL